MLDLPPAAAAALELRYDGPVPSHHAVTERTVRRRDRGTLAALERQAAEFVDAALRCDADAEELEADLRDDRSGAWQRVHRANCLISARTRLDAHISAAAEALDRAAGLRIRLGLPPHPLLRLCRILDGRPPQSPSTQF